MLKNNFDPTTNYRAVAYLRMSSDMQNPRSPDQQLEEIQSRLKRRGYRWQIAKTYRDDGISGRYLRKRPGFQQMLRDIKSGAFTIDLILVDTIERFGRVDELTSIRNELANRHGVLVLTADTDFADPTTLGGRFMSSVHDILASEDGRKKAHNVLRGKRDAIRQGHWPGGNPPFGMKLDTVFTSVGGRQEVDFCNVVPDLSTSWLIREVFQKAADEGWGGTRIARWLNERGDLPAGLQPIAASSVGYWLNQTLYKGELTWQRTSTDIVNDTRVSEPNPEDEIIRVPGFCEAIVDAETWDRVQAVRQVRSEQIRASRMNVAAENVKHLKPRAPGLTLKYLLSGLVRCGHCGRAMVAGSSPVYTPVNGERRRYVNYYCPANSGGSCHNNRHVPESWLREQVVDLIKGRLFPVVPPSESGSNSEFTRGKQPSGRAAEEWNSSAMPIENDPSLPAWWPELVESVRRELAKVQNAPDDHRPAIEAELAQLDERKRGWLQSLGDPDLPASVRSEIVSEFQQAQARREQLEAHLREIDSAGSRLDAVLNETEVRERLDRLADVLAANNPTLGNLMLGMFVDRIDCHRDGHVSVRMCKLGLCDGIVHLLADRPYDERQQISDAAPPEKSSLHQRRRARLRTDDGSELGAELAASAHFVADPDRFAGLDDKWFWIDEFRIPEPTCWHKENALAVAQKRKTGMTHEALARYFGVSIPTIRKALRHAGKIDPSLADLPRKLPRANWAHDHAEEVAALYHSGESVVQLTKRFSKSEPTIRTAIKFADDLKAGGESTRAAAAA